jgi:hypothetical protein
MSTKREQIMIGCYFCFTLLVCVHTHTHTHKHTHTNTLNTHTLNTHTHTKHTKHTKHTHTPKNSFTIGKWTLIRARCMRGTFSPTQLIKANLTVTLSSIWSVCRRRQYAAMSGVSCAFRLSKPPLPMLKTLRVWASAPDFPTYVKIHLKDGIADQRLELLIDFNQIKHKRQIFLAWGKCDFLPKPNLSIRAGNKKILSSVCCTSNMIRKKNGIDGENIFWLIK